MVTIQELIHKLELGEGAKVIKAVTGILAIIALIVWYDLREFKNFHTAEAMEAAQLARNLAEGKGFVTGCIRPLSIHMVEQQQGPAARLSRKPHPDLVNPPLYPVLLAGLMKVLPFNYEIGPRFWRYQPEVIITLFNQAMFMLLVWLAYRLARKLFDVPVAVMCVVALIGSEVLWRFSNSGLSTMLLLVILMGLIWLLVLMEEAARTGTRTPRWFTGLALGAGAFLAAGTLTRYSFGWLVLPVLGFCAAYMGARRGLVCGLLVAAFAVITVPWLARNYHLGGAFFGIPGYALHQDTTTFPEARLERSLAPDLHAIELREYFRKFLVYSSEIVQTDLPKLGGSWIGAFFLAGLLLPFRNPALGRLRLFGLGSLALLACVQALGHTHLSTDSPTINSENLLVLMVPLVFMFGVGMFFILLDQVNIAFPEARQFTIGVFATVSCASLIFGLLPPRSYPLVYPPYLPPWIRESAEFLDPHELMMSDMPWAVAWYGNRSCVLTTLSAGRDFYTVNDEHKAVNAIYLTPLNTDARMLTQILRGKDWDWARFAMDALLHTNLPTRFPLKDARAGYTPDQLLLCDRPRWKEPRK